MPRISLDDGDLFITIVIACLLFLVGHLPAVILGFKVGQKNKNVRRGILGGVIGGVIGDFAGFALGVLLIHLFGDPNSHHVVPQMILAIIAGNVFCADLLAKLLSKPKKNLPGDPPHE